MSCLAGIGTVGHSFERCAHGKFIPWGALGGARLRGRFRWPAAKITKIKEFTPAAWAKFKAVAQAARASLQPLKL
jgi:hypothetical protein